MSLWNILACERLHRLHHRWRLIIRDPCRARDGGDRRGLCSVAVITYGSTQRTVGRRAASAREYNPYETPFKPFCRPAPMRSPHHVTCINTAPRANSSPRSPWRHGNGAAQSCGVEKKPLTVADVIAARPISDPFTVRDCCLVTDGGAGDHDVSGTGKDTEEATIYVLGCGQSITHATISFMPDLTVTARGIGPPSLCHGRHDRERYRRRRAV